MSEFEVRLTAAQARNLRKGKNAILKPEHLEGNPTHLLSLEPMLMKRLVRNHRQGKGCKVDLHGGSLQDLVQSVKNGFNSARKYYSDEIVPKYGKDIRKGLVSAVNYGAPALAVLSGNPEFAPGIAYASKKVSKPLIDFIGDSTHAFGLREDFNRGKELYNKYAKEYVAPHLRKAATAAKDRLVSEAKKHAPRFSSEIDAIDKRFGKKAVHQLGKITHAYGLHSDNSNFLHSDHPAFSNRFRMPAAGGSFLTA